MSWLTPTQYECELLENLRSSLAPELLALAKYTVLTTRIEPLLLRNIRLELMPASEPELEYQLWFSELISARSTRDIVLKQGVARLLADELRADTDEFAKVWALTQSYTGHWLPMDKLEQQLRYDALLDNQTAIDTGLQEILRAINRANDKDTRLNLARWAKKTLPAIAGQATASEETAWLAQYAATALGATANWTQLSPNKPMPDWLQTSSTTSLAKIGLQLRYDAVLGYQVLECLPADDASLTLPLPTPLPATVHIQCEGQSEGVWEVINPGSRIKITQPSRRIVLSTIDGKQYELLAEFDPIPIKSNTQATTIYLTYVREDHDLAQRIAQQLTEQNLQVTLLKESSTNRLKATQKEGDSKYLRLWTPAAQRQWQPEDGEDDRLADSSLLLRWNQTELPSGTAGSQVVDWDDGQVNIQQIQQWLVGEDIPPVMYREIKWLQQALNDLGAEPKVLVDGMDGPSTRQALKAFQATVNIAADGIAGLQTLAAIERQLTLNGLLMELENPQTKPSRRLAIGDRLAELGDPRKGVGVIEYQVIEYAPEVQRLLDELNDINTQPPRRLEIGNLLAEMGDPRFGVGLGENGLPEIDWVQIPAGPFIYGEAESQQKLDLPSYKISRYPVTNSQFQAFIDAGGYQDERWWQDLLKPEPKMPRWMHTNRPRENVNWFEAVAFSRWLSAELGVPVSLPTERQWEKAARGQQGLVYPWGNEFRSGFANCDETFGNQGFYHLKETSAVGIFPQGESPYQVADLAGNVWEWCLNDYDHPERIAAKPVVLQDKDGKVLKEFESSGLKADVDRVQRGGSWFEGRDTVRSALRDRGNPVHRDFHFGFRLVQD